MGDSRNGHYQMVIGPDGYRQITKLDEEAWAEVEKRLQEDAEKIACRVCQEVFWDYQIIHSVGGPDDEDIDDARVVGPICSTCLEKEEGKDAKD